MRKAKVEKKAGHFISQKYNYLEAHKSGQPLDQLVLWFTAQVPEKIGSGRGWVREGLDLYHDPQQSLSALITTV